MAISFVVACICLFALGYLVGQISRESRRKLLDFRAHKGSDPDGTGTRNSFSAYMDDYPNDSLSRPRETRGLIRRALAVALCIISLAMTLFGTGNPASSVAALAIVIAI